MVKEIIQSAVGWIKENKIFVVLLVLFHFIFIPVFFIWFCLINIGNLLPLSFSKRVNWSGKLPNHNIGGVLKGIVCLLILVFFHIRAISFIDSFNEISDSWLLRYSSSSLLFVVITCALFWLCTKFNKGKYLVMLLRVLLTLIAIATFLLCLLFGLSAVVTMHNALDTDQISFFSFETFTLLMAGFTNGMLMYFIGELVSKNSQLHYSHKNLLLYLRSFSSDYEMDNHTLLEILSKFSKENAKNLLKIGNPQHLFDLDDADTFFLPTTNWQKELHKYIVKSDLIFLVIDKTPGLLWEIVEHQEYHNKYIFYFRVELYQEIVENIKQFCKGVAYRNIETLLLCLGKLYGNQKDSKDKDGVAFYYDSKNCIYSSDIPKLLTYHQFGNIEDESSLNIISINQNACERPSLRIITSRDIEITPMTWDLLYDPIVLNANSTTSIYLEQEGLVKMSIKDIKTGQYYEAETIISKQKENVINISTPSRQCIVWNNILSFGGTKQWHIQFVSTLIWLRLFWLMLKHDNNDDISGEPMNELLIVIPVQLVSFFLFSFYLRSKGVTSAKGQDKFLLLYPFICFLAFFGTLIIKSLC